MTTPTGPDPNHPEGSQPGWGAPQQPPAGYNPPGYNPPGYDPPGYDPQGYAAPGYQPAPSHGGGQGPTGQRPGMVTAAGVIGIVWGSLGLLGGVLALIGASAADSLDIPIEITGFDVLVGIAGLAAAIALLIGGIRAMQGKSPQLLLYAAYALIALWVLTVISGVVLGYGFDAAGLLGPIIAGVIVFLLLNPQSKQHYAARGITY